MMFENHVGSGGDSFYFKIISDHPIKIAFNIAFLEHKKVLGYRIDKEKGLIFYSYISDNYPPKDIVRFPFNMDEFLAADFATQWLLVQDYGLAPDTDGDCYKGWQVTNDLNYETGAFCAVSSQWIIYGK
jgi:hypothetical protein